MYRIASRWTSATRSLRLHGRMCRPLRQRPSHGMSASSNGPSTSPKARWRTCLGSCNSGKKIAPRTGSAAAAVGWQMRSHRRLPKMAASELRLQPWPTTTGCRGTRQPTTLWRKPSAMHRRVAVSTRPRCSSTPTRLVSSMGRSSARRRRPLAPCADEAGSSPVRRRRSPTFGSYATRQVVRPHPSLGRAHRFHRQRRATPL